MRYHYRMLKTGFLQKLFPLLVFLAFISPWTHAAPRTLDRWMTFEQKFIDRSNDPDLFETPDVENQKLEYRPDSGKWFELQSVWVPESRLKVAKLEELIPAELKKEFIRVVGGVTEYRLFIHPESVKFYKRLLAKYPAVVEHEATATASSRSLLVRSKSDPAKVFFAKLSLDVELAGVVRTIPRAEVARSVGTTGYILLQKEMLSKTFEIIPEVLGIIPKGWARGGQIIRLVPERVLAGKVWLAPLFSLYARPGGKGRSLLETWIIGEQAHAEVSPTAYVHDRILKPFLAAWADWAVNGSVVMEAHAQNILMELDLKGLPTGRFVHRDMGGFNIDTGSPLFEQDLKKRLPAFEDFRKEYHQRFSREARLDSLQTFFIGGFLFNIDAELARLDPSYRPKSIYKLFWNEATVALREVSGLNAAALPYALVKKNIPMAITRSQARLAKFRPKTDFCERLLKSGFWRLLKD